MRVGEQIAGIAVLVHDHADTTSVQDRETLCYTANDTALADDDFACDAAAKSDGRIAQGIAEGSRVD
jgi:hypothetical protein